MNNRRFKEDFDEQFDEKWSEDYNDQPRKKSARDEVEEVEEYGDIDEPEYGFNRYGEDLSDDRYEDDEY